MIRRFSAALMALLALESAVVLGQDASIPQSVLDAQLADLVELYEGIYRSTPEDGVRDASPILLRVLRVLPPPGRRYALYAEMRHDGEQGDIYRQRLLVFDESPDRAGNSMSALSFSDPQAAAALIADPGLVAAGKVTTRPALGPGCDMRFAPAGGEGFLGRIEPGECVVTGKRGDRRRIEGETLLRPDAIEQLERGYDADMKLLFGNPDGIRYVWPRVPEGGS